MMSRKFYHSRALTNLGRFRVNNSMDGPAFAPGLMRYPADMFLVHKVCEYFNPRHVIEIGFGAGQTLGTCVDACDPQARFTSIDISFAYKPIFDSIWPDQNNMTFIQQDSATVDLPNDQYDFFMVDGDHSYQYAAQDIALALASTRKDGIICVDDFFMSGVWQAIGEQLAGQQDWVPFLMGPQCMFFHHVSHRADDFLDQWLLQSGRDPVKLYNMSINIQNQPFLLANCWIRYENTQDLVNTFRQYDL